MIAAGTLPHLHPLDYSALPPPVLCSTLPLPHSSPVLQRADEAEEKFGAAQVSRSRRQPQAGKQRHITNAHQGELPVRLS